MVELAVAVSVMTVLAGVPVATLTMTGKVAMFPGAILEIVQVIVPVPPTAGVVQLQPAGSGVSDTKVVLDGTASVNWTPAATLSPLLVTVWV